jgi:membrane protein
MDRTELIAALRTIIAIGRDRYITFLAGSIAFFAFLSIIPTVLLGLAVGSKVGGEGFTTRLNRLVEAYLSEQGNLVLSEALANPSGRIGASLLGVVTLFWSAIKVFRAIDIAFDRIYGTTKPTRLPAQILHATVVLTTIGTGILLLISLQILLSLTNVPYLSLIGWPIMVLGLVVVFAPLYYVMPPVDIPFREILPGTVTAVVGLVLLQELFSLFASQANQYQAYGFIGVVLLFLLWLYFGAVVLLSGAIVNATLAGRTSQSSIPLQPTTAMGPVAPEQHEEGHRQSAVQKLWDRITSDSASSSEDETSDEDSSESLPSSK